MSISPQSNHPLSIEAIFPTMAWDVFHQQFIM